MRNLLLISLLIFGMLSNTFAGGKEENLDVRAMKFEEFDKMAMAKKDETFVTVEELASTLTKGALASLASRRAISVFPTPVGPIIRMFLGEIYALNSSASCMRRQRFRSAIATARLAESWPIMYLSSS